MTSARETIAKEVQACLCHTEDEHIIADRVLVALDRQGVHLCRVLKSGYVYIVKPDEGLG